MHGGLFSDSGPGGYGWWIENPLDRPESMVAGPLITLPVSKIFCGLWG
jgi:hypothetical protein